MYYTDDFWKQSYLDKNVYLVEHGYYEVAARDFYRQLFPEGTLQTKGHDADARGNAIVLAFSGSGQGKRADRGKAKVRIMTNDLKALDFASRAKTAFIGPLTFWGRTHRRRLAHELLAFAIDLDYVEMKHLKNLLHQFDRAEVSKRLRPSYLVNSGRGVHLYYLLKEPITLYRNRAEALNLLKEALIKHIWNETTSAQPEDPDMAGIFQMFRAIGSPSKLGREYPARAFQLSHGDVLRYTFEEIRDSIPGCTIEIDRQSEENHGRGSSGVSLAEAKKKWPEWYERRIVQKQPPKKRQIVWPSNVKLYEWWKRKIREKVQVGGRYYSIVALCAFGLKCHIPDDQIRADAQTFLEYLESLTFDDLNHFTQNDLLDALKTLDKDQRDRTALYTRRWIETKTGVKIPPRKRNGRTLIKHLIYARGVKRLKKELDEGEEGFIEGRKNKSSKVNEYVLHHLDATPTQIKQDTGMSLTTIRRWRGEKLPVGRPDKQKAVQDWRRQHPEGRKADCVRDLGLDKKTVYRWWTDLDAAESES